jgi:NADPH-dependent 2,4-dienoyl-CoA reductase/sulfur reductase-like enzyme
VAFERGRYTSYSAYGIPYLVGGVVADAGRLTARDPDTFRSRYAIGVHLRHEVTAIDLDRRALRVRDLDGGTQRAEPFDQLLVATGAVPARPRLPGADAAGIGGVQTLDDGLELQRLLDRERPARAVVVGGGTSAWRWPRRWSCAGSRSRWWRPGRSRCAPSTRTWARWSPTRCVTLA